MLLRVIPKYGRWTRLLGLFLSFALLTTVGALAALVSAATAIAADPPNQPFDLIYSVQNVRYRVYQDGVGMLGKTTGTLTNVVTINGTSIEKAYLVWAGLGRDNDGILFERTGSGLPAQRVTAPVPYTWNNDWLGASTWGCCGGELSVYAADITDLGIVETGNFSYTVSDMAIQHQVNGQMREENWGFSLIVVYADPTLPSERDITIKLGNDGLFHNWRGFLGPNSDVQCVAFPPELYERTASFSIIVGGIENASRPNALWGLTGNDGEVNENDEGGTWVMNQGLINLPPNINGGGTQLEGPTYDAVTDRWSYPFADRNGNEWDEFPERPEGSFEDMTVARQPYLNVPIAPNRSWACLQVESASQDDRPELPDPVVGSAIPNENRPASIGFMGFILVLRDPSIEIIKYTNNQDANDPDGGDVPVIAPGDPVTWTYQVTNSGTISITEENVAVTDNVIGAITGIIDKGDGDGILAPGEVWLYQAVGTAIDLVNPPDDDNLVLVDDVCTQDGA
ncbi:MAG: hypothetical protein KDD78_07895, partial [Caldilineaceae bacterium]|nr:hypothetical protein [Caldilineaceae bacterium]